VYERFDTSGKRQANCFIHIQVMTFYQQQQNQFLEGYDSFADFITGKSITKNYYNSNHEIDSTEHIYIQFHNLNNPLDSSFHKVKQVFIKEGAMETAACVAGRLVKMASIAAYRVQCRHLYKRSSSSIIPSHLLL